ncbi:pentapeptide repeat-containing protein [Bradyrhizobium sp. AUGA SZCCT0222]|uniref:pentapeptide repeat-containing protein n=1 Tax=Bradyrhizobium sp. AUGA SZCCT0222 TaxID=2807668 RepID=UPI001BAD1D22|nr:pentapeptide repeat-containing protein [Bradyrhizobium sp. AUGA SZCCT0222]MBR1270459.1 pentapeptide repeat-containing protein [Bradyrhizobium sp. AUGA SZCCT0222]
MDDAGKPALLRAANDNPWYCLATLYGEQPIGKHDPTLAKNNCLAWNRWFGDMAEDERSRFAQTFAHRTGKPGLPPEPTKHHNFSNTHFDRPIDFHEFLFVNLVDFTNATFSDFVVFDRASFSGDAQFFDATFAQHAWFETATFTNKASFNRVTFSGPCCFDSATFKSLADFDSAHFENFNFRSTAFSRANFRAAIFGKGAFESATFFENASFDSATFSGPIDFDFVAFNREVSFVNTKFAGQTRFSGARFETHVPDFRGATIHEATEWHDVIWPRPSRHRSAAQRQVYAYERLKQEMERLKKHEDEQSFFRRELRARRALIRKLSGSWILNILYELFSDYGNSFIRPVLWLIGVFAAGIAIFTKVPLCAGEPMPFKLAVKLSFSNIFVILPDRRELVKAVQDVDCFSNTTQAINAAQSISGVVLLFLLGLALRNWYRMK